MSATCLKNNPQAIAVEKSIVSDSRHLNLVILHWRLSLLQVARLAICRFSLWVITMPMLATEWKRSHRQSGSY